MNNEKHIANLRAAFAGIKFSPIPITVAENNFNPKLILHYDHIEYRSGFITKKLKYNEIDKVDIYIYRKRTKNIIISKRNGILTFMGNFIKKEQLIEFLKIFKEKGCLLTEKANNEITNT